MLKNALNRTLSVAFALILFSTAVLGLFALSPTHLPVLWYVGLWTAVAGWGSALPLLALNAMVSAAMRIGSAVGGAAHTAPSGAAFA